MSTPSRSDDHCTIPEPEPGVDRRGDTSSAPVLGLVVVHCPGSPAHVGAFLPLPASAPRLLGRGAARASDLLPRVSPVRQRPGFNETLPPFEMPSISREQLELLARGEHVEVVNRGQCRLLQDGAPVERAIVQVGGLIELGEQMMLLCVRRPGTLPRVEQPHPFGMADEDGIVGESPAVWAVRAELRFVAPRAGHVLVLGPTGTGKELVAQAVHRASRRGGALVSRNAATFPDSLIDAELFGNVRGYPNPGMVERKGLIGAADGGTLFLDEVAELPISLQTHLLRVLDAGEFQRLGEPQLRKADLRLVGATNRPESSLKEDLRARFIFCLRLPPLAERREDIPLIAAHLAWKIIAGDPLLRRFLDESGRPRLSVGLIRELLGSSLAANVRDVRNHLWRSFSQSRGEELEPVGLRAESPTVSGSVPPPAPRSVPPPAPRSVPPEPSAPETSSPEAGRREQIQAALDANNGSLEKTWRALGLGSRFALGRLIKKYGLVVSKRSS
jgi:two-component system nitrogen regulation response regulator GlnG/two-component system response regulator HydG